MANHFHEPADIKEPSEKRTLLRLESARFSPRPHTTSSAQHGTSQTTRDPTAIVLIAGILFCLCTVSLVYKTTILRLMEDGVCRAHYGTPKLALIDESRCDVDAVKKQLASLERRCIGLKGLVGSAVALPYGVLGDRAGRKKTALLAYIGLLLTFSCAALMLWVLEPHHVWLVPLSSIFLLIGGGEAVVTNTLNSMVADISPPHERSTSYLKLSWAATMGGVIGPALAGFLMEQLGVWPAVLLTLSLAFSLVGIVLALPETLPQSIRIRPGAAHRRRHFTEHLREHAHDLKGSISLLQNRTLRLTIPALLIQSALSLANASIIITQQHISTYFEWTITQTESWLIVPNLLSLILVPLIPRIPPTITSTSPFTRDLRLAIFFTSIILEGVCLQAISAGVASAPFLIGFTLATVGGAVQAPVVRAMATMHVPRRLTARFFSWVNIAEMATSGVLWFVVRWLFDTGVRWPGLPWLFVAVIVVGAGRGLIEVRPPVEGEGKCE